MNIKKLFPEKKISKKGLLEFLDKKGFYIVLILCIAIVGVTAIFVMTHNITTPGSDYDTKLVPDEVNQNSPAGNAAAQPAQNGTPPAAAAGQKDASGMTTDSKAAPASGKVAANTDNSNKAASQTPKDNKSTAPAKPAAPKSSAPAKTQTFIMPVSGNVSFEFAEDKLVYSKTLEEWRTHDGVDLAADRGAPVKVVADGVISEVKSDPRFGITILVDHQNGLKTIYANLASDEMVSPNQRVKQGEVIGSVGTTAAFESAEQSHLHFEVLKNDTPVDPVAYLPKKVSN